MISPAPHAHDRRVPDPWLYLQDRHPDVKVHLRHDLGTRWGQTIWRDGVPEIHIAFDLGKIQRRCTLAHELVHVTRGAPCRPLCPDDEAATVEATARWLLPSLEAVAEHLARFDLPEAAERLNVTRTLLTQRLDGLTEEEVAEVGAMMRSAATRLDAGTEVCLTEAWPAGRRPGTSLAAVS